MKDQAEKLREMAKTFAGNANQRKPEKASTVCKSISITSGKGGVGKTNIALMLSISLAMNGKKVLLLDADLGLANVHILLGVAPVHSIAHVIEGSCTLKECILEGPHGISVIAGASGLESLANIDHSRLELVLHQFRELEKQYEFLLIDTGAGIGSSVIHFASKTDQVLLVMTPDPASLADAYAMVKILYDKGQHNIGIIINMASSEREGAESFDRINTIVLKFLKRPLTFLGCISMNKELQRLIRLQKMMALDKVNDAWAGRMHMITRQICGIPTMKDSSFISRFLNNFRELKVGG